MKPTWKNTAAQDSLQKDTFQAKIGDLITVKAGETIPGDGKILFGKAYLQESVLTGENLAVKKYPGDFVFAHTRLETGELKILVEKFEANSRFRQLETLKKQAKKSSFTITSKMRNWILGYSMGMGILSLVLLLMEYNFGIAGLFWLYFLLILTFSYKTAYSAGLKKAFQNGIFFKNTKSIEKLAKLNGLVLEQSNRLLDQSTKINNAFKKFRKQGIRHIVLFSTEKPETSQEIQDFPLDQVFYNLSPPGKDP